VSYTTPAAPGPPPAASSGPARGLGRPGQPLCPARPTARKVRSRFGRRWIGRGRRPSEAPGCRPVRRRL